MSVSIPRPDPVPADPVTRRRAVLGAVMTVGGLAVSANADAGVKKRSNKGANQHRTALHQDVPFKAPAARVYAALLDSRSFASLTGMPATIDPSPGGAFSIFSGLVVGRNVELVADKRIVQAWRTVEDWKPGVYSLVKFELEPRGAGSLIALDQTGFAEGNYDHLYSGWYERYWRPLAKFLA